MEKGMEKLKVDREKEKELEDIRAKIEEIKKEALEELEQGERVEYWPGINPKHLEKGDLEIFDLFNKDELNWGEFDEKVRVVWDSITQEKNEGKKNSRQNFIDWLRQRADNKIAGRQLSEERQKENL